MTKRAAACEAASPAKAQKMSEQPSPLLTLIREANLPEACQRMLTAMAPHCVADTKEDRHDFQGQMLAALEETFNDMKANAAAAVTEAETNLTTAEAEVAHAGENLVKAKEVQAQRQQERSQQDDALKAANERLTAARKELAAKQQSLAALEVERADSQSEKQVFEKLLTETWEPLKQGTIEGKEWRRRNEMIDEITATLEALGASASLVIGLDTVLKTKTSERGSFSAKALAAGEELFQKQIQVLDEMVNGGDSEAATRSNAIEEAKRACQDAEANASGEQDKVVEAENALSAATTTVKELSSDVLEAKARDLKVVLENHKLRLASLENLFDEFVKLKDRSNDDLIQKDDSMKVPEEEVAQQQGVDGPPMQAVECGA